MATVTITRKIDRCSICNVHFIVRSHAERNRILIWRLLIHFLKHSRSDHDLDADDDDDEKDNTNHFTVHCPHCGAQALSCACVRVYLCADCAHILRFIVWKQQKVILIFKVTSMYTIGQEPHKLSS